VRIAYLLAAGVMTIIVIFNGPRLFWISHQIGDPVGLFLGFKHGLLGFSYQVTWLLLVGAAYQLLLGVIYWDMDHTEGYRWQFILQTGGTARLLWISGLITLALGLAYAFYTYSHDRQLWPCGVASTLGALITCWLAWLAFPLFEQVGIDRDETPL